MLTSTKKWSVDHDPEATAAYYRHPEVGADCDCSSCRNFAAALQQVFPESFRSLAGELEIDLAKYIELAHYGPDDSGLHRYGGWFYLAGEIIDGGDIWKDQRRGKQANWENLDESFEIGLTSVLSMLVGPIDPVTFIQLEFQTRMPWVIDEPPPTGAPL